MIPAERRRHYLAACLLLPLLVFAYGWWSEARLAQQGQEWLIPITGYDPRDLLRGHFVQYRYDWPIERQPGVASPDGSPALGVPYADRLCIIGTAPRIVRVRALPASAQLNAAPTGDCAIVVRASVGTRPEVRGLESGIFFASEARALQLSRQLAEPTIRGFVRVRIRPDGLIRPVDLMIVPRARR